MKKLNKKQKEHIKKVFVKTINIFCYVCTGILALFLLITCLQSCRTKTPKGVSAEELYISQQNDGIEVPDGFSLYVYNFSGDEYVTIPLPNQVRNGVDVYEQYSSQGNDYSFNLYLGESYFIYSGESHHSTTGRIAISYSSYLETDAYQVYYWSYRIKQVLILTDEHWITLVSKTDSTINPYYYNNLSGLSVLFSEDLVQDNLLEFLFSPSEQSTFIFNKRFNYNAPFGVGLDMPYNPVPPADMPVAQTYMDYDIGTFISNGQYFNKIRWNIRNNNSGPEFWLWVGGDTGHIISSHDSVGFTWVSIEYINTASNLSIKVCERSTNIGEYDGAYVTFYNSGSIWQLDSYRRLDILSNLSQSNRDALERFNNNNQNSVTGNVTTGGNDNIFTLIGSAFSSWLPILSIYLLPGITLGTLVFIPLVALLVFAIIRIIKK